MKLLIGFILFLSTSAVHAAPVISVVNLGIVVFPNPTVQTAWFGSGDRLDAYSNAQLHCSQNGNGILTLATVQLADKDCAATISALRAIGTDKKVYVKARVEFATSKVVSYEIE